ncbi:MAG: sensor histidine kinase [Spirochaetes bacterium]|uniref:Sensor histidine kinase n=1 Tax=Candidatus Ornithospirochaeta stercoripullorum TaxID=2840899 RepID=A0A9D9E1K8_9SPIO|nr:sensor histidine kinase [Candidatus Ornithospirochaeta stercoripullorum]
MKRNTTLRKRLMLYFLIVMLLPLFVFLSFYLISGDRTIMHILTEQASLLIDSDAQAAASVVEKYRHKSYQAAQDALIQSMLESGEKPERTITSLYHIMEGDTYLASLTIWRKDGMMMTSTHNPSSSGNEWDTIRKILPENREWIVTIDGERNENGHQIAFTIVRRIRVDGEIAGYAVINVYSGAITPLLDGGGFFSDLLLIDKERGKAASLMKPQSFYDIYHDNGNNIVTRPIAGTNLMITGTISRTGLENSLREIVIYIIISLSAGFMLSLILTLLFSRSISRSFSLLSSGMKQFEKGDFSTALSTTGISEFDELSRTFNSMVKQIEVLIAREREEEAKAAEAERKALESQLNPHFLFNTLSTIKALAHLHGEEEISIIATKLGKLLRYSINNHSPDATIKESLELAESYLMIQKIRFGERLEYSINCPDELLSFSTPRLLIQPLAENAVTHGLEGKTGDWKIEIKVKKYGANLSIIVEDNGTGFDASQDFKTLAEEGHTGLYNIKRRLELRYGNEFSFMLDSAPGKGTKAIIIIPYGKEA